ncbi:MAG: YobA family protein [Bacillus sp. (in: Bacteria)]|nr:YobA family protein [Bacillus sp. (in: firmicutes)]
MKYVFSFLFFLFFIVLVGCGQGNSVGGGDQVQEPAPFYVGEIVGIDGRSLLVEGTSETYDSEQFYFRIEEDTQIVDASGEKLTLEDIRLGVEVEIWLNEEKPDIMESYPPQAYAGKIKVK